MHTWEIELSPRHTDLEPAAGKVCGLAVRLVHGQDGGCILNWLQKVRLPSCLLLRPSRHVIVISKTPCELAQPLQYRYKQLLSLALELQRRAAGKKQACEQGVIYKGRVL